MALARAPAASRETWLLLAILLWLNNGLRYIWDWTEFNLAKPADRGAGSGD